MNPELVNTTLPRKCERMQVQAPTHSHAHTHARTHVHTCCELRESNLATQSSEKQEFKRIKFTAAHKMDCVVGIATGYGLDDRGVGVRVLVESRIFSTARRPDRLWGPPSFLSNGYRGKSGRGVKMTIHFQLVPWSIKCGSIHSLPLCTFMA
jgi:hypothetical protein